MKLTDLQLDDKMNFNLYISSICKSAANQLNSLISLRNFANFEEKKILIKSCFMANFNKKKGSYLMTMEFRNRNRSYFQNLLPLR